MGVQNLIDTFNQNGFVLVNPRNNVDIFNDIESEFLFKEQWEFLEIDPYLNNLDYRSRRYSER